LHPVEAAAYQAACDRRLSGAPFVQDTMHRQALDDADEVAAGEVGLADLHIPDAPEELAEHGPQLRAGGDTRLASIAGHPDRVLEQI
jgi:hypothetical protein